MPVLLICLMDKTIDCRNFGRVDKSHIWKWLRWKRLSWKRTKR